MSEVQVVIEKQEYSVILERQTHEVVFNSEGLQGPSGSKGDKGDQGDQGIQGPPGSDGGRYTHVQTVPSDTWTINHNLGYNPNISIVDSVGNIVEGNYQFVTTNQMVATFSGAFSGTAYLS